MENDGQKILEIVTALMGERKQPVTTKFDKINLALNLCGPAVLMVFGIWALWSFNARLTIESANQKQYNSDNFVTKAWFEKSHAELMDNIKTMNGKVDVVIQTGVSTSERLAHVEGELGGGVVRTKGNP